MTLRFAARAPARGRTSARRAPRLALLALALLAAPCAAPAPAAAAAAPSAPSASASSSAPAAALSAEVVWRLREEARGFGRHAFESYMAHAWPWDELKPLTCAPRRWDRRERGDLDDALGGYSLTLVDSLDALAMAGDLARFRCAVATVVRTVGFGGRDVNVSVFETVIRVVGGLLSAHLLAADEALAVFSPRGGCGGAPCERACGACPSAGARGCLPRYEGQLLHMARELALRLLPAFDTPSGLPFHRVNLGTGAVDLNSRHSCTAAAGTLLLEFGLLSRLSGDARFEAVARRAVRALWRRRSAAGLLGNAIDVHEGTWLAPHAGVGAGTDSFFEYLLKAGVALDDGQLVGMHAKMAAAIREQMTTVGGMHVEVLMGGSALAPLPPLAPPSPPLPPRINVAHRIRNNTIVANTIFV